MTHPLFIDRIGGISSAGLNWRQTVSSLHGDVSRIALIPVIGADGQQVRAGAVPLNGQIADGQTRSTALLAAALADCAAGAEPIALPLVLCVPGSTELPLDPLALLRQASEETGVRIDGKHSHLLSGGGHAAFGRAVAMAGEVLARGVAPACYVAAVDTFLDIERLRKLISAGRIASDKTPDGFLPAEGAVVFRVLARPSAATIAILAGVGLADEPSTRDTGKVSGVGQTTAARAALSAARVGIKDVEHLGVDLAGDRHRFYEVAITVTRLKPEKTQKLEQWSAAPVMGELGCVDAPIALGYMATAFQKRWFRPQASKPRAALYLGADDGKLRTGIVLQEAARG